MIKKILTVLLLGCVVYVIFFSDEQKTEKKILFVCTGNYYRSRFAEAYFNWKVVGKGVPWSAVSRGLKLEPGRKGIAREALQELALRGVPISEPFSDPQKLTRHDLLTSDYIVVLDEVEHRPLMEQQFHGGLLNRVHYWHIHDIPNMQPKEACAAMAAEIDAVVAGFEAGNSGGR